jgi:hypothetical protein
MCDHEHREAAMVTIARDESGTPTVWCDPCLAPLIQALNNGGLPTVASCCGHGHRPGTVALRDGRHLLVADWDWFDLLATFAHERTEVQP